MLQKASSHIQIKGACTNNLKNLSLSLPHNLLIAVTGPSGSGKSSLIFDVIAKEGQRRYFETLPSFARQFMGKLNRPDVDEIDGLSPVIAIGQRTTGMHARSTVGTLSDSYDLLRLLYARTGKSTRNIDLSRALFSFNSSSGKCQQCNGIGKEEQIDLQRLVSHPKNSIREGALAPTLPNGYIMYSQVTIDVLNQVCNAEGFNVDIPWNDLSDRQQNVVLYGSDLIKVPFGKHSLESRLKWTGIKAKPREEGYYKGLIPIMSDILRRDRNPNILKYVHAVTCPNCNGTRLNADARSVTVHGKSIAEIVRLELNQLKTWIEVNEWGSVALPIVKKIAIQIELLEDLGLGHLTIDRPANTLRPSEIQRIRIANQILVPLSDVLYVFDEPSIGLHHEENQRLIFHLKQLVQKGNTVIVVEHDLDAINSADHILEIGPGAGINGGEVVFNGSVEEFSRKEKLKGIRPSHRLSKRLHDSKHSFPNHESNPLKLFGCFENNLKNIDVSFQLGYLNVVSGKSGTGKSSLVKGTLLKAVQQHLGQETKGELNVAKIENIDAINKLIFVDHSPIGRTPRSNPATYLGISDYIRDVFAKLPASKEKGFTRSRYSFNNKGGRCETCQGAGKTQIGMHFLGNVELVCGTCNGDRFNEETLRVTYKGLSIAEVYRLSVSDAITFFEDRKKVLVGLQVLEDIGLGYLTLGQSSTTLSGGEAQRIKIANQLQKRDTGDTLYVIIEPSIGLHQNNIQSLLELFDRVIAKGNTVVCIEQDEFIISQADWHIELGPKGGAAGGQLLHQGLPKPSEKLKIAAPEIDTLTLSPHKEIRLDGVTTHGLKNINVCIPKNQLTVVTGLSGSGKSSLVYDTLFAEANARFTESLSTHNRSFLQQNSEARIASFSGLGPAIGINRKGGAASKRSTVGTLSGVYDALRLLYSRIAQQDGEIYTAQHFSFNHHLGACPACEGLGVQRKCDPDSIIIHPDKNVLEGAISLNKAIRYYADVNGQFIATLKEVALQKDWNIDVPWNQLDPHVQEAILFGTGGTMYDVTWQFTTKSRTGTHVIHVPWLGFCGYIDEEYQRKRHNKNVKVLEELLHEVTCATCKGSRLKTDLLKVKFFGKNIHEFSQMNIASCLELIENIEGRVDTVTLAIAKVVLPASAKTLQTITSLGLGYLNLDRSVASLSGGERQRITLAGQLSTHLFGVTYVLDEPSIGLDAIQIGVLAKALKRIVKNGNTVVVVEHDKSFIEQADYLIEMGPGAGSQGGEVVFQGKVDELASAKHSLTYKLLNASLEVLTNVHNTEGKAFGVTKATANNLKSIDVAFYAKQITAIRGVSGSGKSSLIKDVLYATWQKKRPVHCAAVSGLEQFEEVLLIDQLPLKQSRLSSPATYTGIMEHIKSAFAKTHDAKKIGLKKADFSYQSKKGKCPTCNGYGKLKTSMDFMSDIWLTCDACKGMRYSDLVLTAQHNGLSIGEVLQFTVAEAGNFFESAQLTNQLEILKQVGLGHLKLGQSGNTLSGGEAQRLKLATSMLQNRKGTTLYLFDEPSTGLHYFDILKLLKVFQSLIDAGDTILFIEHNTTMIEAADRVIAMGPESGEDGGEVV